MAYNSNLAPTEAKAPSLLSDSADLRARLVEITVRCGKIADQLHGSDLASVGSNAAPEPSPTVHRNLVKCHEIIGDIESELRRIENRL